MAVSQTHPRIEIDARMRFIVFVCTLWTPIFKSRYERFCKPIEDYPPLLFDYFARISFLAASWSNSVSTSLEGIWMYRTTDPRIKQFFMAASCGCDSASTTLTLASFTFKYWSTDNKIPVRTTSFFISTQTSLPTNVLKNE